LTLFIMDKWEEPKLEEPRTIYKGTPGSSLNFNINNGYLEGLLRGYRSGFLRREDYVHMGQCETLEDMKLFITSTEYGDFLANEPPPLHTTVISEKATEKLVNEFLHLRVQANEPLATFLDYITYQYMIDNVVLLITGSLHESNLSDLLEKCHPLGKFAELGSISAASTTLDLYNAILETPLGKYVQEILTEEDLDEMNVEIIRNSLYKQYLMDFYNFCNGLGGQTAELMARILSFEADRRAINITINSIGTEMTKEERTNLYPEFGDLYPDVSARLGRADELEQVHTILESVEPYRTIFGMSHESSLDEAFFQYEVELNEMAFWHQFNYAVFYSYVKLKEQEIRNIVWIAECIQHKQKSKVEQIIPIFGKQAIVSSEPKKE